MPRIAGTVNEALAVQKTKLLGKRAKQEKDKPQGETQNKRKKTTETGPQLPEVMNSIEDSDGDDGLHRHPPGKGCNCKEDERYRAMKAAHKTLKRQDEQLASLCGTLDENIEKQGKGIEQLTKQQKELRKDVNANKRKHQQLAEQVVTLEAEKKSAEERVQQLVVQCAALTDDIRKVEDKIGQTAAKCSASEDENKLLRSQIVSLVSRVESLESAAQTTPAVPVPPSAPKPTQEWASVHPRQHSVVEVSRGGGGSGLRDMADGVATPTAPSSQWQCAGTAKYEYMDGRPTDHPPPRHYQRASSRFPRILNMPTFDPSWNPQQEILGSRHPGYTRFSQQSMYSGTVYFTTNDPTPSYSYPDPAAAARAPTPAPNPVQQPVPADMSAPVQAFAPAPSDMPASNPPPVEAPVPGS